MNKGMYMSSIWRGRNYFKRPLEDIADNIHPFRMLTVQEIAHFLDITERTVYTYIKKGKIKAVKIGKGWRVSEGAYIEFVYDTSLEQMEKQAAKLNELTSLVIDNL